MVASMRRAPFSTNGTQAVEDLRNHLETTAPDGVQAHVTGIAGLAADQAAGVVESFDRTAIVTVILVLIILLAIYRSVVARSEEHTSELQSLMRISYAVF